MPLSDVRHALRLYRRSPGFTLVATLTLALGIGANVAVFSIVYATLLQPPPYRAVNELVEILDRSTRESGLSKLFASYADLRAYQEHSRTMTDVAGVTWAIRAETLTGRGPARGVMAVAVTSSIFQTLGVKAALGRTFTPADETHGCSVVLSHGFWSSALHQDRSIVGRTLALDRRACTVVGVMPAGFAFYPPVTQLWTLLTPDFPTPREQIPTIAIGRLKPGVTLAQAEQDLTALHTAVHSSDGKERGFVPSVDPLQTALTWLAGRNLRTTLWVLFAAVGVVLLLACWNVAGLLLGRGLARTRELAVRAALGGERSRLVRQLLTEALLLAGAGGAAGVALAFALVRWFRSVNPVELPPGADVHINVPVLAFAAFASLAATVAFALIPAWKMSHVDLNEALQTGGRGIAGRPFRFTRALVAAEVAGAVLLLAGGGLLMESVLRMRNAPLGFEPDGVFRAPLTLNPRYNTQARARFYERLLERVSSAPGVTHAAIASMLPPGTGGQSAMRVQGRPFDEDRAAHDVAEQSVTPGYLETLRVPLLAGRDFTAADRADSQPVALINHAVASKYFGNGNALGAQIRFNERDPWITVVGIIGTEKRVTVYREMDWVSAPMVYRPIDQQPAASVTVAVRTAANLAVEDAIPKAVAGLDSEIPLGQVEPLRADLDRFLAYPRFRAALAGGFSLFALLLAALGLEGVLAQMMAQRRQEVGIRMALGATPASIVGLVARDGGVPVVAGLGIGFAATAGAGPVIRNLLYEASPLQPAVLAGVAAALLATAAVAIAIPARRASRTDPMEALRQ
ncbi:MAG TPA: ABC transporter permease [Candidatus Limnocylindrales bacterium]|nr:ABC transporter permease [Candidatus Limnocylindrales bacterium]